MAMAVAANKMGTNLKLYIPKSTLPFMVEKLQAEGVDVIVTGNNWNEANAAAERELESQPKAFMVHPFGQETTWKGHSSLVTELRSQMPGDQVNCSNEFYLKEISLLLIEREFIFYYPSATIFPFSAMNHNTLEK